MYAELGLQVGIFQNLSVGPRYVAFFSGFWVSDRQNIGHNNVKKGGDFQVAPPQHINFIYINNLMEILTLLSNMT